MSQRKHLYLGKGGELYVMSEFLARGWNVTMPQVDVGDDIFVVEDNQGIFQRVQVKTGQARIKAEGYSVQFKLSLKALQTSVGENLHFVFVTRKLEEWADILIIRRKVLADFYENYRTSFSSNQDLILYFSFKDKNITCSGMDFTPFLKNFSDFPIVI